MARAISELMRNVRFFHSHANEHKLIFWPAQAEIMLINDFYLIADKVNFWPPHSNFMLINEMTPCRSWYPCPLSGEQFAAQFNLVNSLMYTLQLSFINPCGKNEDYFTTNLFLSVAMFLWCFFALFCCKRRATFDSHPHSR